MSPGLLEPPARVLRYPKLREIAFHPLLPVVLEWLHRPEHVVIPQERITTIQADPADNLLLEAAVAGAADAIVTGDHDLPALKQFRRTRILTAREFATKFG
jgi:putative PIN family toxin of toxin-antitoxin system